MSRSRASERRETRVVFSIRGAGTGSFAATFVFRGYRPDRKSRQIRGSPENTVVTGFFALLVVMCDLILHEFLSSKRRSAEVVVRSDGVALKSPPLQGIDRAYSECNS